MKILIAFHEISFLNLKKKIFYLVRTKFQATCSHSPFKLTSDEIAISFMLLLNMGQVVDPQVNAQRNRF